MNQVLLFREDLTFGQPRVVLSGRRFAYLTQIQKRQVGDQVPVGVVGGPRGMGQIFSIGRDSLALDVKWGGEPEEEPVRDLILALPRPKLFRRVLKQAVVLGASRVFFINSGRVEKSYWQSPSLQPAHWRDWVTEALELAGHTRWPEVHFRERFRPFVEDEGPALIAGRRGIVAHPQATEPFPKSLQESAVLVVGPEGGWSPFEMDLFAGAGFQAFTLGPRILPVEVVLPYLWGRLT